MAAPITTNLSTWNVSDHNVERLTDNIPFTTAHPDDTLVCVGPPRFKSVAGLKDGIKSLTAVGMLQSFSYQQQRGLQPMQAIGSGRAYFVSGKSTVQFTIARLFVKGNNLMKALYSNALANNVPVTTPDAFGERAVAPNAKNFVINLDSELFLVPFGLMISYRDRANSPLGTVYLENCMLASAGSQIQAGQTTIMESVTGLADRVFAVDPGKGITGGFPVGEPHTASKGTPDKVEEYLFGQAQKIGNEDQA